MENTNIIYIKGDHKKELYDILNDKNIKYELEIENKYDLMFKGPDGTPSDFKVKRTKLVLEDNNYNQINNIIEKIKEKNLVFFPKLSREYYHERDRRYRV